MALPSITSTLSRSDVFFGNCGLLAAACCGLLPAQLPAPSDLGSLLLSGPMPGSLSAARRWAGPLDAGLDSCPPWPCAQCVLFPGRPSLQPWSLCAPHHPPCLGCRAQPSWPALAQPHSVSVSRLTARTRWAAMAPELSWEGPLAHPVGKMIQAPWLSRLEFPKRRGLLFASDFF